MDEDFTPVYSADKSEVTLRFFASKDPNNDGRVTMQDSLHRITIPLRNDIIPVTQTEYNQYSQYGYLYYEDNAFIPKQAPTLPLVDQARNALASITNEAMLVIASGSSLGSKTTSYVARLRAIVDGTDTTSTSLPDKPASTSM